MKDHERWIYELEKPPVPVGGTVSEQELEQDASSFVAFAAAFGVTPPTGGTTQGADPPPVAPVASEAS